jgi:hypothetical protein
VTTHLSVEDVTEHTEDRSSSTRTTRLGLRLLLGSVVAAVVPIAVAAARAINDGWIPTGDNALFAVRSRDLFTHNLPLIGTWSSASLTAGTNLNHPGPLYFDLLAVPARLVDSGAGIALGVALINVLCVIGIAAFAYRRGAALVGTVATAAVAALCWAMGSQMLFEPWNPHSMMLPFLLFLVLVWSLADGDLIALPFAAFAGSLIVQTHLSYVLLVPVLGAWGVVSLTLRLRRDRRDSNAWSERRSDALRYVVLAVVVFALCWIQPLIEQFTGDGQGNLTRLVDSVRGSDADTIGYAFGTRVVATVVALPPWWFRPSMKEAFNRGWDAPSAGVAALGLVVLTALLAWCAWDARRRHDQALFSAVCTAVVALLAAVVTAGHVRFIFVSVVWSHVRWLWPLGAFVFFAVAGTVARRLALNVRDAVGSTALVGGFAGLTVVLAAMAIPYADQASLAGYEQYAVPGIRELQRHMGSLEDEGPVLIDDVYRAYPYGTAVVAELQRREISFVVRDAGFARQFGDGRRYNGENAKAALLLRQGSETLEAPPGVREVARGEGMSGADVRDLDRLKRQISNYIGERNLQLNPRGQAALQKGKLATVARQSEQGIDVATLFTSRELDEMIRERYLVLDDAWAQRFERYADLKREWDQKTVALFVAPVSNVADRRS